MFSAFTYLQTLISLMKKFLVYLCLFAASCLASWFIREQPVEKLAQPEPDGGVPVHWLEPGSSLVSRGKGSESEKPVWFSSA